MDGRRWETVIATIEMKSIQTLSDALRKESCGGRCSLAKGLESRRPGLGGRSRGRARELDHHAWVAVRPAVHVLSASDAPRPPCVSLARAFSAARARAASVIFAFRLVDNNETSHYTIILMTVN